LGQQRERRYACDEKQDVVKVDHREFETAWRLSLA
jgi:hypothetical protein